MIKKINSTLLDAIEQHKKNTPISFHVPGHKNGLLLHGINRKRIFEVYKNDLTELSGLDNLHYSTGIIAIAEAELAKLYKSKKSFFLINGSTVGNLAMIFAGLSSGDEVLVQRNCHQSIFNGLTLVDAVPIFISWEINYKEYGSEIDVEEIIKLISTNPSLKAVILTYPSYYGDVYELKKVIELAHEKKIAVLVDEAHGAHFILGKPFPKSAIELGADVVVQSAHKTLPALTMGAYLHMNSELINEKKVKKYLRMLQSSSPSYPIMVSLDFARDFLAHFSKADILYTLEQINFFKESLKKIFGLKIIQHADPLKISLEYEGVSGFSLLKKFEECGVFPEMASIKAVLLIMPLLKKDFSFPFLNASARIANACAGLRRKKSIDTEGFRIENCRLNYRFSEMEDLEVEKVFISEAVGRISAENIIPYPPGVPLLLCGEKISVSSLELLQYLRNLGAEISRDDDFDNNLIKVFV